MKLDDEIENNRIKILLLREKIDATRCDVSCDGEGRCVLERNHAGVHVSSNGIRWIRMIQNVDMILHVNV
jgi:hypothetical protein